MSERIEPLASVSVEYRRPKRSVLVSIPEHTIAGLGERVEREMQESTANGIWRAMFFASFPFIATALKMFFEAKDESPRLFATGLVSAAGIAALIAGFMSWRTHKSAKQRTDSIMQWFSERLRPD